MGKNKNKDVELEVTENTEVGTDEVSNEDNASKKKGGRNIVLTLEDGTTISRVDYCRKRYYEDGASRGTIAGELSKIQGKTIPYQIVFQACKDKSDADKERAIAKAAEAEAKARAKEASTSVEGADSEGGEDALAVA